VSVDSGVVSLAVSPVGEASPVAGAGDAGPQALSSSNPVSSAGKIIDQGWVREVRRFMANSITGECGRSRARNKHVRK
jgi:hypothetical protein